MTLTLDAILQNSDSVLAAFDGFIFDCDGTLADSMPVHYLAWCAAFRELAPAITFTEEHFYSLGGLPTRTVALELAREQSVLLDADEITLCKETHYLRLLPGVQPIPPVVAFARAARALGRPISVGTGTMPHVVKQTLTTIGMLEAFEIIITPEHVALGKPAPDIFLLAAERMGTKPGRTLVFEDGPPGFRAADAAGMRHVVVEAEKYRAPQLHPERT
jgi:HAD superfamily hydrolase (TIGR01509 family)